MAKDLAALHAGYDVSNVSLKSHRRFVGPAIALSKKLLRQLLSPILTRQVAYNAANTRIVTHLQQEIEALRGQQVQLQEAMRERVETFAQQQVQELQVVRERVSRAERKLRLLLFELTGGQDVRKEARLESDKVNRRSLEGDFDYGRFQERFRGSEAEIKERQRAYVQYFQGCDGVLDIGCGRGEFLELLSEAGIPAKGVDADLDMILLCREKGLDVQQGDVFIYLEGQLDESVGGIFSAQLIEHFPPEQIIRFVRLCYRKVKPGGIVVLETLNPQCLSVFARAFYLDFSHVWPCHPEAMRYLLESVGFADIQVVFSSPVDHSLGIPSLSKLGAFGEETERFNRTAAFLNELLLGPQDYAIIGRRRGSDSGPTVAR